MATIVTRAGKGSPLTNTEVDANFTNLNTDKIETVPVASASTSGTVKIGAGVSINAAGVLTSTGATNLSNTPAATNVAVESSTGTNTTLPAATTSAAGVLSAADKTKLDGGAASGLHADLLDGQHGSYYTGYADTAVSNLVDSSPAALNTLNELAAALGDDANFSTTITDSVATKLPKAGGAMTGAITTNSTFDGRDVATDGTKLDTIATSANNYAHPTGNGNQHIPADGATGKYLKYASAGTAQWGDNELAVTNFEYTATANQTAFSGSDNNSATLAYTVGGVIVSLNGIILDSGSDYTASNGTLITLATGAAVGDHFAVIAFSTFSTSDTVSATSGGTFGASVTVNGNVTTNGNIVVTGTVDGRDLQTDGTKLDGVATSANNYVHPTTNGNKHVPAGGATDQVLKYASSGTAQWADAGGAFAASTVTVSDHTTLTAAQNGNLVNVTATAEKIISLPAAAAGAFYVFNNDTSHIMYIKPNGTNTINGFTASLALAPAASGIMACGGSSTNWSSVGITRTMIVAKSTTFYNSNTDDGTANQITGTYTPILGTSMLISVGSCTAGAHHLGTYGSYYYRSGASGGSSYAEKFIASPAASYAYTISGRGTTSYNNNTSATKTTTVAGMTCTRGAGPPVQSSGSAHLSGRAGGTATGGTVNFTGGTGATPSATGSAGRNAGGGGAATRAGNGGNGALNAGGGTGGNNASQDTGGAAATAKDSNSYAVPNSTSETYQTGVAFTTTGTVDNRNPTGASPKTLVNIGGASFAIADHANLATGATGGAGGGGYSRTGTQGGYVTFVEFI